MYVVEDFTYVTERESWGRGVTHEGAGEADSPLSAEPKGSSIPGPKDHDLS